MTLHKDVLREVLADTYRKHAPVISALQATLKSLNIDTGATKK